MRKSILFLITLLVICSCESNEYNSQLRSERISLEMEVNHYKQILPKLKNEVNALKNEKAIYSSGRSPKYMVGIKIHQGTFTLDPFEHIKNSMNDITIWMETTEKYYNSVKIGDEMSGKLKSGSFWIDGDISHLHITIADKKIQ